MLTDRRTWSTLAYLVLMLPIGIIYFVIAVVGLSLSLSFIFAPLIVLGDRIGWWTFTEHPHISPAWRDRFLAASVFWLKGSAGPDAPVVKRTRAALA